MLARVVVSRMRLAETVSDLRLTMNGHIVVADIGFDRCSLKTRLVE